MPIAVRGNAQRESRLMTWWVVGAAANTVILVAYAAISLTIASGLTRSRQWRSNPLGAATAAIFFTCAVHHGSHPMHQLLPYVGLEAKSGIPMRAAFDDWHVSSWDVVTAAVGVWYWSLRNRFPALVRGSALFEDLKQRQKQALELNDNVVQGLTVAKYALEAGDRRKADDALDVTLARARRIVGELLGEAGSESRLAAGDLARERPAEVVARRQ